MRTYYGFLLMVSLLVFFASPLEADTVIYRKADKVVAGWVRPPQSVAIELGNILQSEGFQGATAEDFAVVEIAAIPSHHEVSVNSDGSVSTKPIRQETPVEIPLADFGAAVGGIAGAASLVIVARKRKT